MKGQPRLADRGPAVPDEARRTTFDTCLVTTPLTIETRALRVACELAGPEDGPTVVLLHGWPDDARTWDRILPSLHAAGWRTVVPFLRGFGPTRFRDPATIRSGQLSALGQDLIDLADSLTLSPFVVVGHDWGARAAYIAASQLPGRITHCVALSVGYGTNDPGQRLALRQARNYWYHWYMALDRGAALVREEGAEFARFLWETWSPGWPFPAEEFDATASSFANPDWAEVTLHSYRHRWALASGDPAYEPLERRLSPSPRIEVPTLVIHGAADGANHPSTSEGKEQLFAGPYDRLVIDGVGHFPQREAADVVAERICAFLR
jgi:pimeloyl-ACP methyl ester carboxylesterase